jgi:hypothetical protein
VVDTSYKIPEDAEKDLQLPILVSFPLIYTEMELKQVGRKNIFIYIGVSIGFILLLIGILVAVKGV